MELVVRNQLELAVSNSATSLSEKLLLQKELLCNQIYELENLVNTQCMLTGVNPLSQEMAAGALCVKIGKRPRDLLNPKAIQYMQFIFSIKDSINKKETREIIASFGVTASQVRDFFTSQRAKVRKFIRLSKEKVKRPSSTTVVPDGIEDGQTDPEEPLNNPVPLDTVAPTSNAEVVHSFSALEEKLSPAVVEAERYFVDNIFSLMRKEETFSGQAKLMEWILQIQNTSVLFWFSVNGGIMILATWLSEAIVEEQTSILHVILKVLCHLPLQKATPVHMSAVLQSVNKLRFYRASDISNRARVLLSKWSKTFANMQAQKRATLKKTASPSLDDMLLTQCINEVMGDDLSWDSKAHLNGDLSVALEDGSGNLRKLDSSPMKLLTSSDDQNKKLISGGRSSQSRERRKVLLVEQPGQRSVNRTTQVSRHTTNSAQRRPLSADDIQKAKIRAQFMQSRYGKPPPVPSSDENNSQAAQINIVNKNNTGSEPSVMEVVPVCHVNVEEEKSKIEGHHSMEISNRRDVSVDEVVAVAAEVIPMEISNQRDVSVDEVVAVAVAELKPDEPPPPPRKRRRLEEINWNTPPEIEIDISWRVGTGENSKELEIQKHRLRREHETVYKTNHEIPSDPKSPWDREMDYDDTLTPQIPIDQLPDDTEETPNTEEGQNSVNSIGSSSSSLGGDGGPDLELLAELLKNPQLVFALTSGQGGNLSSNDTVKLLDMIKKKGVNSLNGLSSDFGGGGGGGGKEKADESKMIEVSLPSPTPSSDPVTNGRIADLSKNPFSRGKQVVNDNNHHLLPMRASSVNFPATSTTTTNHHLLLQQQPLQHQHLITTTTSRVSSSNQYNNIQQQQTVSELLHTRNTHSSHVEAPPPYNNHRAQPSNASQPPHWQQQQQQHRQQVYQQYPTMDHHQDQYNHNTEAAYGGAPPQHQFLQDEARFETWNHPDETNQEYGGAQFETWNHPDDNSPARSRVWNNNNNRAERTVVPPRNYGHPPPNPAAYGDQSWNNGNKRWNDRRR